MAKYGNILIIKNATNQNIEPVKQYLDSKGLRNHYQGKILFYEIKKMSQLDEVEQIADANNLKYIQVHGHHLPGNYINSNYLPAEKLDSIKVIWAP